MKLRQLEVLGRIYLIEEGIKRNLVPKHNWEVFVQTSLFIFLF